LKPFAESSEQNKQPILSVLQRYFATTGSVLEIGSGTGQHAVYFAAQFPHLNWLATDREEYHAGIRDWMAETQLDNVRGPLLLDVNQMNWPLLNTDAVFSANTVHIMDWSSVENMFAGIGRVLRSQGFFCLYGPFNYQGKFSSESNANFDIWLKARDANSGVRDFEALDKLAGLHDLVLLADHEMPANNRILVWQKAKVITT